jgi:flavin-dependent dehydrogenase
MRYITIVGAGQAGLQLGIGLLKQGYYVTLVSNKTASELLSGPILSNQGMFDTALQYERDLGLNFYEHLAPKNKSVTLTIANNGQKAIHWKGFTDKPFQAIDQRLKFSRWLQEFEALQGNLIIKDVNLADLENMAKLSELTIVASGKGEIGQLFERDSEKSLFDKPQRALACHYVKGMMPVSHPGVRANIIPGVGEYFTMPGLTLNGQCEMMLFEGVPGGKMDCWQSIHSPEAQLEKSLDILKKYVPWEAERCKNVELTDEKAVLKGRYTPVIRKPYFKLPQSGKPILGIGDAIVLNDPIAGQGANNASKAAKLYMDNIIEQGNKPFDEPWMQTVFDNYWRYAQFATKFSTMQLQPPAPHMIALFASAAQVQKVANKLANGFNDPSDLFPWIDDMDLTKDMISQLRFQELKEKQQENFRSEAYTL